MPYIFFPVVSLQDIHLKKAFRSSKAFDQQVVSRDTMPKAMLEAYLACDKPPPLDKLNPYREDGKDGLKFYTDPTYFFELWRQEMLKDTERMMHDRGKKVKMINQRCGKVLSPLLAVNNFQYPYISLANFINRNMFDAVRIEGCTRFFSRVQPYTHLIQILPIMYSLSNKCPRTVRV